MNDGDDGSIDTPGKAAMYDAVRLLDDWVARRAPRTPVEHCATLIASLATFCGGFPGTPQEFEAFVERLLDTTRQCLTFTNTRANHPTATETMPAMAAVLSCFIEETLPASTHTEAPEPFDRFRPEPQPIEAGHPPYVFEVPFGEIPWPVTEAEIQDTTSIVSGILQPLAHAPVQIGLVSAIAAAATMIHISKGRTGAEHEAVLAWAIEVLRGASAAEWTPDRAGMH